ncbi:Olfactory receptor 4C13, partial [Frankliniella fusca]
MPRCVAQDEETLECLEEWRKFPSLNIPAMRNQELIKAPDQFWHEMGIATDAWGEHYFKVLPAFALSALAFPHSNASCERDFSKINNMKTKIRNRLVTPTVRALVLSSQSMRRGPADQCCHSWSPATEMRSRMTAATMYRTATKELDVDDLTKRGSAWE